MSRKERLLFSDEVHDLEILRRGSEIKLIHGAESHTLNLREGPVGTTTLEMDGRRFQGAVTVFRDRVIVACQGRSFVLRRARSDSAEADAAAAVGEVSAPMTGKLVEVSCAPGATVAAGDLLCIVEAMKMEHRLEAPAAARVTEVLASAGDLVDIGQVLVRLDPLASGEES